MTWLGAPAVITAAYYLIALVAAAARLRKPPTQTTPAPAVSILKPVHGRDPNFYEAIHSHALLDFPEFEILFGVSNPDDPARADILRLAAEFPERPIRLVECSRKMPNGKVAVLAELAAQARYPVLVINDSDIVVERDYLRNVTTLLEKPGIGLATCLYRAEGATWPSRWEALGIATDFAPSVLVARALGVAEFALGSTMALRAKDLVRIGGFDAIGEYLADDYQLGHRITEIGGRIGLAQTVVETHLGAETWGDAWRHQLRWARTIRVSRTAGYYGYVVTNASVWAGVALIAGAWPVAIAALAMRILAGVAAGAGVLGDRNAARWWFLMPFRDLWGFAVWVAGLGGTAVEWRGEKLRLRRDGRIEAG